VVSLTLGSATWGMRTRARGSPTASTGTGELVVEDSNRPAMSPLAYREVTHPWHRSTRLRAST
jgi:hypothetical protein